MGLEEEGHGHSPNPELIPGSGVRGDSSNRKMGWGGGNPMPKTSTCKLTNNTNLNTNTNTNTDTSSN